MNGNTGKDWYLSKGLWIAIITAILGILAHFGVQLPADTGPDGGIVLMVLGIIGIIIRIVTKKPVVWTNGKGGK